jgi:hypothetical protein
MNLTLRALAAGALLLAGVGAGAQAQAPAPNTLTPEEVSAGWILLWDGQTPFGWQPRGEAKWDVKGGVVSPVPGSGKGFLSTTTVLPNYRLRAEFWVDDKANSGIFLRCPTEGEITSLNAYEVNIYDAHEKWPSGSINDVAAARGTNPLAHAAAPLSPYSGREVGNRQFFTQTRHRPVEHPDGVKTVGRWNTFDITADGGHLVVVLNGVKTVDTRHSGPGRGTVALQYNGEGVVKFRNVKLQPLGLQSIFNGRDLSGWKQIPDRKSVYTVTPQGWMNVKDGNGDIQTTGTWKDFVFQLDIISNGTHLNSGVFFRGDAGQFWSGYESQIRNQWEGTDRTKPVDFGTGGIYNRQPTRRVIPNDREWFTKTIVAHGRHMAVWINGIQVSDYYDVRPPNDNARQGYREKAGIISLQGHDPTTDLSFRNLKVAEMPAK